VYLFEPLCIYTPRLIASHTKEESNSKHINYLHLQSVQIYKRYSRFKQIKTNHNGKHSALRQKR